MGFHPSLSLPCKCDSKDINLILTQRRREKEFRCLTNWEMGRGGKIGERDEGDVSPFHQTFAFDGIRFFGDFQLSDSRHPCQRRAVATPKEEGEGEKKRIQSRHRLLVVSQPCCVEEEEGAWQQHSKLFLSASFSPRKNLLEKCRGARIGDMRLE